MVIYEGDKFDNKYLPAEGLPPSVEYPDESNAGMYGWSREDAAVLAVQNPLCIWTFVEGDGGSYMMSGMRFVNRLHYFVSSVPRASEEPEEYLILRDEEEEETNEE